MARFQMMLKRFFVSIEFIQKDVRAIALLNRHIETMTPRFIPKLTFCVSDNFTKKSLRVCRGNLKINRNDVHKNSF
jgi:hypothetical protein